MDKDSFLEELKKINVSLTEHQLSQLNKYYHLIIEWNKKINLTRITDEKEVYLKHFYDSLTLCKNVDLNQNISLCDIGTGAGFPGIVLKIVFPSLSVTLVDALLKRVKFLNIVISELELEDIVAVHARAEDFAKDNREKFDIVTSRAVADLKILLEYSLPLLKVKGLFIPMKANCDEEINNSLKLIKKTSAKIININRFSLPNSAGNRTLITIIKNKKTSLYYPKKKKNKKN